MTEDSRIAPEGRVIMVSGANRGIGEAVARRLYDDGYSLSLGARRPDALQSLLAEMDESRVMVAAFEARDPASPAAWVAATVARFGRLDGLVSNAGVTRPFDFDQGDEADLDEMLEINAKAPMRLIRAARPHLKETGRGRIVVVTSLSGVRYKWGSVGYSMSKHAAQALTHAARVRLWDEGIRVTAVSPGPVETDMTRDRMAVPNEQMTRRDTVADLVATAIALPNTASVAVLGVNAVAEPML